MPGDGIPEGRAVTWIGRPWLLDAFLVSVTGLVNVVGTLLVTDHQPMVRPLDFAGVALLLLGPAALWWRRRYPVQVLVFCFVQTAVFFALPYAGGPVYGPLIVSLVTAVIARRRMVVAIVMIAAVVVSLRYPALLGQESGSLGRTAALAAWLLFLASVGEVVRSRRALVDAERQRMVMTLQAEADEVRRRAIQDRLHLARDLHDVIGHHLAVINVQATAGLETFAKDPQVVLQALTAVRDASRDALNDVQSFLDSLRGTADHAPREPAPTLLDLDRLVAPARASGVPVHVSIEGSPRPLPAAIDLAACRVVQEALTNVLRHVGRPLTWVRLAYGRSALVVTIDNDKGSATPRVAHSVRRGGEGIPGMRARVEDLGGAVSVGPTPRHAWSVVAELPIPEVDP
jgi:signal transduction histidine kinase